jgi:hypothetical protein
MIAASLLVTRVNTLSYVEPVRGDARCSARHSDVESLISVVLVSIALRQ